MKNVIGIFLLCAVAAFAGPYDAWSNYRTVTVNTTTAGVTGTVANFPLLVRLTNADAAHGSDVLAASATGADVRFTDSTGSNALSYQVERWTSSAAEIWVSVPSIAGSSSTPIRMYWGNGSATSASNGNAVFDTANGFVGAWHLGDAAGIDPRPNQVVGAPPATPSNNFTGGQFGGGAGTYVIPNGIIGLADSIRGGGAGTGSGSRATPTATCDYINLGSAPDNTTTPYTGNNTYTGYSNFTTGFTFSVWFKPAVSSIAAYQYISELANTTNAQDNIQEYRQSATRQIRFEAINGTVSTGNNINNTTNNSWTANTWTHMAVTFGGHATDTIRIYVNGVSQTLNANGIPNNTGSGISNVLRTNAWLGKSNYTTDGYIQGVYDEPEFSKVVRSADWTRLSYQTQVATQTAVTLGTTTTNGGSPNTIPTAPTAVTAVPGNAQAAVTWVAPSSNGGAAITAYTATAVQDTSKHCATSGALTCTVSGLTNGTSYTFTVTATNSVGVSPSSSASTAVIPVTVPGAPTAVLDSAANAQVIVKWTAPASNGGSAITGYTVTSVQDTSKHCTTTGSLTCTVNGLTNGTGYSFTVIATNAVGSGAASSASAIVTPSAPPGAPTAPASITAVGGNGSATLTWPAGTANGSPITGYIVTSSPDGKTCSTTGALTCVDSLLSNGTSYTFTVIATSTAGNSGASAISNAVTPVGAPGAPTAVVGTSGNAQVAVSWTAPASNGGSAITAYTVTTVQDTSKHCSTTGALTCTVTGLTNGTSYTFTVKATNSAGTSAASAASSIGVTPATVPGAPTTVTGVGTHGQVVVSWVAPTSTGGSTITGYTATASQDTSKHCATTGALTCTITGLTDTVSYTFTVIASNAVGKSSASSPSAGVTNILAFSKDIGIHMNGSSMSLRLPEITGSAQISIVDLWGRVVWSKTVGAGVREVSWGRGSSSGRSVVPGIYIVRVMLQDASHRSRLAAESKIMLTP